MDFETPDLQRQVDLQEQLDPNVETQKPNPTYFEQVGNAFSQERLTDNPGSEYNQVEDYYDEKLKETNATTEEKDLINNYVKHGRKYEPLINELVQNGELIFKDHQAIAKTDKAHELLNNFMLPNFQMEGYSLSKKYNLDYTKTKPLIIEKTRKKYQNFEKDLGKDSFLKNFGSQFMGATAGWFTDATNVTSLVGEVGALKLINPLFKMTKIAKALELSSNEVHTSRVLGSLEEDLLQKTVLNAKTDVYSKTMNALTKKAKMTQVGIGIGVETTANALGESYRQSQLYGFKHEVLPEYDLFDVAKNVGLVSLMGGASGALTAHMENKMLQKAVTDYTDSIENTAVRSGAGLEVGTNNRDKPEVKPENSTPLDEQISKMDDVELDTHTQNFNSIIEDLKTCATLGANVVKPSKRFNKRKSKKRNK